MDALTFIEGHDDSVGEAAKIGILVASDRASSKEYLDEGGPAILQFLIEATKSPLEVHYRCIPDTQALIESMMIELADEVGCHVIVTTGGTGPAERDVTPEATERVVERIMPALENRCEPFHCNTRRQPFCLDKPQGFVAPVSFSIFQDGQNQFEKPLMKFGKRFHTVWI